ncbi:MAG: DUF2207 domain-containing protein [Candidatus Moraniibacteriota bacterium]
MFKKIIQIGLVLIAVLFIPFNVSLARENVTDWYIQDFNSEVVVNKDSSLNITETIIADCGTGFDKHGIFRILPEKVTIEGKGNIKTPVELISITDSKGNDYSYTESKNSADETVTWKIGEADKTVQGVNTYVIKYQVKNAIRFYNDNFDELYWNLTGNFWDLEIDRAHIEVKFPQEIMRDEVSVDLYSGLLGRRDNELASFYWGNEANLVVDSNRTLAKREGITVAVTFAKNIFTPYAPTFWEKYGNYIFLIIPLAVFVFCFRLWKKYGDDLNFDRTVIAEYEAPKDISPTEIGLLMTSGKFKNHFITAEIINFAVLGIITIKEIENKILFFTSKDYEFNRIGNKEAESKLVGPQKIILNKLFEKGNVINISSLKNDFYKILKELKDAGNNMLANKNLIVAEGLKFSNVMIILGSIMTGGSWFWGIEFFGIWLGLSMAAAGAIILFFGFIMPKRTLAGAEMNWQIKGFKLFMETVDKDRAKFYEQENIFEKFLPYAVLFGITDIWIKRIKEIYGEEYFNNYTPAWYVGNSMGSFNADNFSATLSGLSSSIAASTSAPSGSGGSGSSGGGGGGGGGGGW